MKLQEQKDKELKAKLDRKNKIIKLYKEQKKLEE